MKPTALVIALAVLAAIVFAYAQREDPRDLTGYASTLIRDQRFDEAFVQLHRAVNVDSDFAPAHLLLGDLYYQQNNYPKAIEHYKRALPGSGLSRPQIDRAKSRLAQIG